MINGHPHWIPPTWLDPTQTPRRNTAHHVDLTFDGPALAGGRPPGPVPSGRPPP
jgi:hypothetical protein